MERLMSDATELWEVYDPDRRVLCARYGDGRVRMLAFGLRDGGLAVVSPGAKMSQAHFDALAAWGEPRFLVAPNAYHNLGLRSWSKRFPDAQVVAHERALKRLRKKLPELHFSGLDALVAALPDGVRLMCPPQAKQGEVWVSLATAQGRAWFVVDGILNEAHLPPGALGVVMRVLGFRTGLITNPFFKRLFLSDKAAHKAWVREELTRDPPALFLPCHGEVLVGADVPDKLRAVTNAA